MNIEIEEYNELPCVLNAEGESLKQNASRGQEMTPRQTSVLSGLVARFLA